MAKSPLWCLLAVRRHAWRCLILFTAALPRAHAITQWNAGDGDWNVPGNWLPNAVPDNSAAAGYGVRIGDLAVAAGAVVTLVPPNGTGVTLGGLELFGGAELRTQDSQLDAGYLITIDGAGTMLTAGLPSAHPLPAVRAESLTLKNGGRLAVEGGTVAITRDLTLNEGCAISGRGTLEIGGYPAGAPLLRCWGLIEATGGTLHCKALSRAAMALSSDLVRRCELRAENAAAPPEEDFLTLILDGSFGPGPVTTSRLRIGQNDTISIERNLFFNDSHIYMNGGTGTATLGGSGQLGGSSAHFHLTGSAAINNQISFNNTTIDLAPGSTLTLRGLVRYQSVKEFIGDDTNRLIIDTAGRIETVDPELQIPIPVENRGTWRTGGNAAFPNKVRAWTQTASGILDHDLGGTAAETIDRLVIDTTAALNGTLAVRLKGGFVPAGGQTFEILTAAGGVTGTFSRLVQPFGMPPGLGFSVSYLPDTVRLTVVPADSYEVWSNAFLSVTDANERGRTADADNDGLPNFAAFALDGNVASPLTTGRLQGRLSPVAGVPVLTYTIPVRTGTVPAADDARDGDLSLQNEIDLLRYTIQASADLTNWTLTVAEVTGGDAAAAQTGLPSLDPGWEYRTFRGPPGVGPLYLRARITEL